jgi:two-component system CheB/CheR fusion protein
METEKPDTAVRPAAGNGHLSFPIVGIGASAGGFPALAALLRNLPPSPDMALVVILHLASHQHSNADRVLQAVTNLPVVQVDHPMPILPNHVYVIAPGRSLKMQDGYLVPHVLDHKPGDPETIDVFFRALAMAHKENAIGIVLSGMGADGTAGLACIKEQGGVAIVQLPADAEQGSMPQSAIDSGMADFVLTAAQIPAKLMELRGTVQAIRQHALLGHPAPDVCFDMGPDPQGTLDDVLAQLHAHTGNDFRHYKPVTLLRRLERRLQVRGVHDLPSYRDLQRKDPGESRALLKDLLIGVTQFFRDRAPFAALEETVLPQIFHAKKPGDTVRVWVPACSTGEEAYSVAMLLADQAATMAQPPAIQVFASDIDAHAIRTARAGLYPAAIAADVPAARLRRYFTMENGGYKVRKALREKVLFAEHNVLRDAAFSALDLITCRNFLIYLNREMYRHLLGVFHFVLNPGGYLMLGSAESTEDAPNLFAPIDTAQRIYRSLPVPASLPQRPVAARAHVPVHVPAAHDAAPAARPRRLFSFADIHLHKAAELAPPSILVDGDCRIVHIGEGASRFLRHVGGEPTRDLVALVAPELRLELRTALFQARKSGRQARTGPVRYSDDGHAAVDIAVLPFEDEHAEGPLMLVTFAPVRDVPPQAAPAAPADAVDQPLLNRLDDELQQTRHKLLDTIDQAELSTATLRTAMEELRTTVDELRSANGELETANAELRSTNEELKTVNTELRLRLDSLGKAHDDLNNLVASSDVATLFLDRKMRILRYTPRIADLFNVIPADVGRPLLHITSRLDNAHLAEESQRVFGTLQPLEQQVRSKDGRDYIVRVYPYRTGTDHIDGAVMTFFDITSRRLAEKALRESEQRLALAFATVPIGIGTVDTTGHAVILNDVMRHFLPTGVMPSRDPARVERWRGWDAAGAAVPPRDFPGARALRGEDARAGMQMLYLEDDGKETWTEVRAAPLRDADGTITGALLVVIDVDRLKRSEEAARASAQRHAFLLAAADALRGESDADAVALRALRLLADELRLDRCCIVTCRPAQDRADVACQVGNERLPALPATLRLSDHPCLGGAPAGKALAVGDAGGRLGIGACMAVTLRAGDVAGWAVVAACAAPRRWTPDEIALVEEFAERAWAAIDRARAEATAASAERRAEAILELMGDAHSVLDRDYHLVGVNAAAERLLGMPRAALLGQSHWEVFPASVDAPVGQALRRVVEDRIEQHLTHHYTGEGYDLHLEVDAYPTDEGGVAMFWRDVTERVRAEAALRASEEKYRALFNEMDEAYAVVEVMADAAGQWTDFLFLEVNPAFVRHTGMPYPVGRTATQLLGTPNPHWAQLYGRAAQTGEPIRLEEGELTLGRVFDLNIFRLGGPGSRRVAVLFADITERKRADAALRESEERYRTLFDTMAQGYCEVELVRDAGGNAVDRRYVEFNPAFARMFGAAVEEARGRPASAAFPAGEPWWHASFDRIAQGGTPERVEYEVPALGRRFEVQVYPRGADRLMLLYDDVSARRPPPGEADGGRDG